MDACSPSRLSSTQPGVISLLVTPVYCHASHDPAVTPKQPARVSPVARLHLKQHPNGAARADTLSDAPLVYAFVSHKGAALWIHLPCLTVLSLPALTLPSRPRFPFVMYRVVRLTSSQLCLFAIVIRACGRRVRGHTVTMALLDRPPFPRAAQVAAGQ